MKKALFIFLILFSAAAVYSQSSISGIYMIGDKKASISADEMSYWLLHEDNTEARRLQYEEDIPEGDHIWLVWHDGKQEGTLVFKSDYSGGKYTDYRTGAESVVMKIEQ